MKGEMKFWDADVKKPLGAVSAMIDEGNTVVFNKKRSYIRNDPSGEEIEIKIKVGTFVQSSAGRRNWSRRGRRR